MKHSIPEYRIIYTSGSLLLMNSRIDNPDAAVRQVNPAPDVTAFPSRLRIFNLAYEYW
jgi:hypothetical protein